MSAMAILAVGIFVTGLCAFGLWYTIVEIRRLSSNARDR
jgi:hypothetical protein